MNLWGKIIGTATGYAVGNGEGALVGAFAGHVVDMYTSWAERQGPTSASGKGQTADGRPQDRRDASARYNFTLAIVSLGAKLAKVDGPVTRAEVSAFKEVFRVPPEELQNVGSMFDRARVSPAGYERYAEELSSMFADHHDTLDEIVGCLFHVAIADGPLRPEETDYIRRVTRIFGFSETYFQRRLNENSGQGRSHQGGNRQRTGTDRNDSVADPYAILGISASTPDKEIKIRYRKLVRQHHPDSLVAAGKSKAAVLEATSTLARINAAYDQIAKERHIN